MSSEMSKLTSHRLLNTTTTTTATTTTTPLQTSQQPTIKSFSTVYDEDLFTRNYFKESIPLKNNIEEYKLPRLYSSINNRKYLPQKTENITTTNNTTNKTTDNNNNNDNDTTNNTETYAKRLTTEKSYINGEIPSKFYETVDKQSEELTMKPNETLQKVDYLLYDAPAWMRQSKVRNHHKVIGIPITTTTTTSSSLPSPSSHPTPLEIPITTNLPTIHDGKHTTENIKIIRHDNGKNNITDSRRIQSHTNNNNNGNNNFIQSNESFRLVKSGSRKFPEMNLKHNHPSYMQKLDDVNIGNEMNTDSLSTIKTNKFNINTNYNDWSQCDNLQKFTSLSPTSVTKTTIPLIEKINELSMLNRFNELSSMKSTECKSDWHKNRTSIEEKLPSYQMKPNIDRIIRSTPCSPTLERNIIIKSINDDDVIRNNTKPIGLPPRPLRSPVIRVNGRSMSPTNNRQSFKQPSSTQFNNGDIITSTRIDPTTGEIQHITSRTRSYTDLSQNALVTEVEENIRGEGDTEVRVVRRKTRRIKPNVCRESRSVDNPGFQHDSKVHQRTEETKTEKRIEEELNYQCSSTKVQPQRTSSQMNISGPSTMTKTGWLSETNLRNTSVCKQPPMYSTYSAHKENLRQMQEQRRTTEDWQASNRQLHDSRSVGSRAVLEEMETITLQPIGRGVHDLEPTSGSIARSVRATTPSGLSTFTTLMNRPHSSAGRIDLGASGTKRSISKEYYSPFRMQRSTIDIPYSQTTNALISPPINRRLVGFANINPTTTRISSINRNILPTINHDTTMYDSSQLNSKWNIHSSNRSQGIINQSHFNRNSYARQTLTQNIQEMTQKQRIQSPNQLYYATPNHNELANRSYAPGWDQQDGFRTIATTNYHREMHTTSGPQSPYLGAIRQNSQYEATPLVANRSENQWKTVTPFSPTGSLSGTNIGTDVVDGDTAGMRQVLDTSKYWYLPGISRPDVIALLRDKEAGSFVIRNSNTYADSFGLALKVPPNSPRVMSNKEDAQSEWVRHFLIGTVPMHDGRGNGVHLRGFSSDPTFPSLAAFVHYHIHRQGALPCTLRLPVPTNQMLYNQQRTTVNDHTVYGLDTPLQTVLPTATTMYTDMLYLGSVEVDRLENMNAAIRGISKILSLAQSYSDGLPKRCEVQIKVLPHEGITFTEKYKRGVWKKIIKPNNLLWCGMDPENREFNDIELRSKGVYGSKVFALVARKQRFWLHENVVYVFCEIDNNHPAINLVRFINSIFPGLRD